ncbi:MAG: aldo/keto reductase [Chloroflexi bacterium]|nr:aldo/keto reductase [Chloroflexota bacterium]
MRYRTLGRTGLEVSEVGFGAWAIGGNAYGNSYGPTDDETSVGSLHKALELGCTFFDTADVYGRGHSEELLGTVLGSRPDVVVATKVGGNFYRHPDRTVTDFSPKYIRFACEQSLRRLRREAIDLYQLHNPPPDLVILGHAFQALDQLRQEGKIRFYGLSIRSPYEGLAAIRTGRTDTLQLVYNLLRQEAAQDLLPAAQGRDIGTIAREPLHNGFLTSKYTADAAFVPGDIRHAWPRVYIAQLVQAAQQLGSLAMPGKRTLAQVALRFVLDNPAVSCVIPGSKTPEQVVENMAASELPPLLPEDLAVAAAVLAEVTEG